MTSKQKLLSFFTTPTARLAATHLAIIMCMSIVFSVIFYNASTRPLERPTPSSGQFMPAFQDDRALFDSEVRRVIEERLDETRKALATRLVWINFGILIAGSAVSYMLARRSLTPIEEAMEAQSQFISDASHELRTPLTVLQTTNEVALRKSKLSIKDAKNIIAHNVTETKKLRDLSNMLLELLKNDAGAVSFTEVDIQEVVSESLNSIVAAAQAKNIVVEDSVKQLYVKTNKALLGQILGIFLDNAVKYSKPGGVILLSSKQEDEMIHLSVKDEGAGIHASDLPYIFQRFYRADKSRTTNETSGYGLGLAIADKISKKIHIKIEVSSKPAKGSTFTLIIPRAE